ncbi:PAS domain-containing protein [Croceibacterium sp. TMG7-5b_MA50]|uniref:sensor histidine kinase n=1 Tax=Croceibacterium sp. TMG7-5b_MA50 TaxID=3121290 RepID=UPI00322171DE
MKPTHLEPWPDGRTGQSPDDARLAELASFGSDALTGDEELDGIVRFAAQLCDTPISLVSLVKADTQMFLARTGLDVSETPRDQSFCAHAMHERQIMQVPDATQDGRFVDNPLVTGAPEIRFYAGQPLVTDDGVPLGSLCVIDSTARPAGLTQFQQDGLAVLARAVMRRLNARRSDLRALLQVQRHDFLVRALADSVPALVWSADAEGQFTYFNQQMQDFTGCTTLDASEIVHPEDLPGCKDQWAESIRTGQPYELEHRVRRHDGEYRWVVARAAPVHDDEGRIVRWFGTATDIDSVHRQSESRDLLARELSHRIKNIFAVVAGLISLSARKQPQHKSFADELTGTIRALGRAHDYVRPTGADHRNTLLGLLGDLFQPYTAAGESRVRVVGDDSAIAARAATPLALVFHELATNSAKYGALGAEDGVVDLTIDDRGDTLLLRWTERGGPAPAAVERMDGFGSRLVEMSITGQLGGSWERRFEPEGLVCALTVAKTCIAP